MLSDEKLTELRSKYGLLPLMDLLRAVAEAAVRAEREGVEPEPFRVGNTYRTEGGKLVTFVSVHREGTSCETMADEDGVHRYTRRDFGRVTGAARDDYAVAPLYLHPPQASATVPEGMVLVPIEPTESMLESARLATESEGLTTTTWLRNCVYRAMLAAAPSRPGDEKEVPGS